MSSRLPNCWKHVSLSSISERIRQRNSFANSNALTISAAYGLVNQKNFFNKIVASENLSNYFILRKGDFAYNKSYSQGYPVGVVRRLERYESGVLSPLYICFSITNPAVDQRYAQYYFDSQYFIDEINQIAKEGVRNHGLLNVGVNDFFNIEFVSPPLPEQQKIATILSSVDDVIEKTRAQIDKLKDLKTGMMQELLTQGIGHTEFKDSSLGRIPASWTVRLLDEVARRGSGHTPSKSQDDYWNGNIQWVSLSDSNKLDQLYITDTSKKISQLGIENSSAVLHPSGTVIMSRDAGIGKSAILAGDMAVSQHFMAWICSPQLNNYFLYYLLQNWKQKFEAIAMGSTIKTIGLPFFKTLEIPMPSIQEQQKIANALKSLDLWIFSLEGKKEALDSTKKALMQDLLTGKVRVRVNPTETAAA